VVVLVFFFAMRTECWFCSGLFISQWTVESIAVIESESIDLVLGTVYAVCMPVVEVIQTSSRRETLVVNAISRGGACSYLSLATG
jgi:hypothetical protein